MIDTPYLIPGFAVSLARLPIVLAMFLGLWAWIIRSAGGRGPRSAGLFEPLPSTRRVVKVDGSALALSAGASPNTRPRLHDVRPYRYGHVRKFRDPYAD